MEQEDRSMITGIHHISLKCGTKEAFEKAKDFYLNVLGFSVVREWPEGIMIDSGAGQIEIFSTGKESKPKARCATLHLRRTMRMKWPKR